MKFKDYHIDMVLAIFAMTFIVLAIVYNNFAFIGATLICLIFGVKKIKKSKNKQIFPKIVKK